MDSQEQIPPTLEYATQRRSGPNTSSLIWSALFALAVSILVISILLSAFSRPRITTRRGTCAANLKAIATACLVYSEVNKRRLPPALDVLTLGGSRAYLQTKQLVCPTTGKPYIYVKNLMNDDDPRQVLAFEPLGNHADGANVAFLDGHVRWHLKVEHLRLISQVQTRPARIAPGE